MPNILIRDVPADTMDRLDELAKQAGQSREEFLRQRLSEVIAIGGVPVVKIGDGLRAMTKTGGKARLVNYEASLGGGASNLSQEEFDAYNRAKLVADPRNGGDWQKARQILEAAGFEVYWD